MGKFRIDRSTEGYEKVKVCADNEAGFTMEIKYVGIYYRYKCDRYSWRQTCFIHMAVELLALALLIYGLTRHVNCNMIPSAGGIAMFAVAMELFCLLGIGFFITAPQVMTIPKYHEARNTIYISSCLSAGILGIAVLGCLIYIFTTPEVDWQQEMPAVFGYFSATVLKGFLVSWHRKLHYEKLDNHAVNQDENYLQKNT